MEAHPEASPPRTRSPERREEERNALATQWRTLTRAATFVAVLTSPAFFVILYRRNGWSLLASVIVTGVAVIGFRGFVDVVARKMIPSPRLYGADKRISDEDVIAKRRLWYWRTKYRRLTYLAVFLGTIILLIFLGQYIAGNP